MAVPVEFLPQSEADLIEFVPFGQQVQLLEGIVDRLGRYPEIGVHLEAPDHFARAHHFGHWVVYWEPIRTSPEAVARVEVLRIVPDAFSRLALPKP